MSGISTSPKRKEGQIEFVHRNNVTVPVNVFQLES